MTPKLIACTKIWDKEPHCAMTDLLHYKGAWLCAFRESDKHVYGKDGIIRIIQSRDGKKWSSIAEFSEEGLDFRDPKLSVAPDGSLMLLIGVTIYKDKKYVSRQSRVGFSEDGISWSAFKKVVAPHEWLWRVTWHEGVAYGATYRASNLEKPREEWHIKLFKSNNGIDYDQITQWEIHGYPSEATIHFLEDGTMVALVRRDKKGDNHAWIGTSKKPFVDWQWKDAHHHLGGPNFTILPDQSMWAAGRLVEATPYGVFEKTCLAQMAIDSIKPVLILPSGGEDTSYPGLVFHEGEFWVSYYSSHEGTTAIYLAQIGLN
jgi:hypothetical protein